MDSSQGVLSRAQYTWKYIGYFRGNAIVLATAEKLFHSRKAAIEEAQKVQFDFPSCYNVELKIERKHQPTLTPDDRCLTL